MSEHCPRRWVVAEVSTKECKDLTEQVIGEGPNMRACLKYTKAWDRGASELSK